jgi:hypothetical protein
MVPGLQDLLHNIKTLEEYVKAGRSGEEEQFFPITREEMEVVKSFRRFMAPQDDSSRQAQ